MPIFVDQGGLKVAEEMFALILKRKRLGLDEVSRAAYKPSASRVGIIGSRARSTIHLRATAAGMYQDRR